MAEEQGIEAAWERFMHPEGGLAPPYRQERDAARALALATLEDYVAEVQRMAEADVIAGRPLEGAHYRAMSRVATKHRARIEALD